ncbi:helicase domain protein, partial [Vibrio parahaemolyticus V-223/04]
HRLHESSLINTVSVYHSLSLPESLGAFGSCATRFLKMNLNNA